MRTGSPPPRGSWPALELDTLDLAMLRRYWLGSATPQEVAELDAWFDATPGRRQWYEQLRRGLCGGSAGELTADEVQRRTAAIMQAIHTVPTPERDTPHRIRIPRTLSLARRSIGIGVGIAMLAVLATFAIGTWQSRSNNPRSDIVRRYATNVGQRSVVRLDDGSIMTLGPATTATLTSTTLDISGEIYLAVAPNSARSIVVRTQTAVVRVLGTAFSVRQYPDESNSRVVVENGKVSVHARRHDGQRAAASLLTARMLAQVTDSGITVMRDIVPRDFTSWKDGWLVFNRMALRDVVAELTRVYGAEIRVADSALAGRVLHMDVSVSHDALDDVLEQIGKVTQSHVTRVGRAYVLIPGSAASSLPRAVPERLYYPQQEPLYGK